MSQFIPLQQAIDMTTLYRQEKENILATAYQGQDILARSETFDRDVIDILLAKEGCVKLRIYYGMDESLKVHAILVAVNDKNENILPALSVAMTEDDDDDVAENAYRCPPQQCAPPGPLDPP